MFSKAAKYILFLFLNNAGRLALATADVQAAMTPPPLSAR
jgi:hypothetical protein